MAATKFTITGGAAQVAGDVNPITITADDISYVGDHDIVFSGANDPPLTASPSTTDKNAISRVFGVTCTLTFVDGVATSDMVLTKAETVDVACTDGTISAAGADRLNVVVTAGVAVVLDYKTDNGPTVVAGTQFEILEIDAIDAYGNIDLTYDFPAGKNITFSGVGAAPDGTLPSVTDIAGVVKDFGLATSLAFNLGQAVADGTQLKAVYYRAALSQLAQFTDGALTSVLAEGGGFLSPKAVDVLVDALDHFDFVLASSQLYGVPFTGTNTLTALDQFDNLVSAFDASLDNVTVAEDAPLTGTVSGLGSLGTDVLDQASDFVNGVANLTGTLTFTGSGVAGTFTATAASTPAGTSGSVGFNLAEQGMPILIEAPMGATYQNGGSAPNGLAIYPRAIQWDNPGAAGHKVVIKASASGSVLYEATAKAQYDSQYVRLNKDNRGGVKWIDFIVTQLDSGQLFIWY